MNKDKYPSGRKNVDCENICIEKIGNGKIFPTFVAALKI